MTKKQAHAFFEAVSNNRQRQWWLEHIYCLDGLMKFDMEEFDTMMVNHSDDPSVVTREDGWDYTTRDVQIGPFGQIYVCHVNRMKEYGFGYHKKVNVEQINWK
ncbi:uncharacterized protein LOC124439559 [Xenia sp. Carnegie-2017]|uniref:uncharacterized protein LOC124439559 n=1 Tax=Xenia sp. Carnegie-2017 TaxID=2897299 RepID=UPI001F046D4D|nr:uncharacterized protein LOC124439559 [Xenia sp. Carnegie-2017]